tara:strand:- start:64 stop:273 length:210 start_codon:yes stop_codon:yes gene_type:complete
MNIFWIGLIFIIIFLLYQYRSLEIRYKRLIDDDKQEINIKKIVSKIYKIEKDLSKIKQELHSGEKDGEL